MSWLRAHVGATVVSAALVLVAVVAAVTVWSSGAAGRGLTPGTAQSADPAKSAQSKPAQSGPARRAPMAYLGVYEPGAPDSYVGVAQFAQAVGRQPNIVLYYSSWRQPFATAFARTAASHGALTLVQIDPAGISLAQIAAGGYDSYLISYAKQVAAFGHPVAIGFGHEMNGFWYSWGYGRTDPAVFVAAWRHIVDVFRAHGAVNVKWVWTINRTSSLTPIVRDWWPGDQYVTWVGVDGYYYRPGDSFRNIFAPVIAAVRRFTNAPVLLAETAVGPLAGQPHGIDDLFTGVYTGGYLGLIWFDHASHGDIYHQNWRLEGNLAALAAFRRALHRYG